MLCSELSDRGDAVCGCGYVYNPSRFLWRRGAGKHLDVGKAVDDTDLCFEEVYGTWRYGNIRALCEDIASPWPCGGTLVSIGAVVCSVEMDFLRKAQTLWGAYSHTFIETWLRTVKAPDTFSREVLQSPPLDIFKTQLVKALRNLIWSHKWSCFKQEIGLQPPEASPSPLYPLTHWFLELILRDGCHSSVAASGHLHRAKNQFVSNPHGHLETFENKKDLNCDQLQSMKPIVSIHPPMFSRAEIALLSLQHTEEPRSFDIYLISKERTYFKELVLLM